MALVRCAAAFDDLSGVTGATPPRQIPKIDRCWWRRRRILDLDVQERKVDGVVDADRASEQDEQVRRERIDALQISTAGVGDERSAAVCD
jgi:hypothetical protein